MRYPKLLNLLYMILLFLTSDGGVDEMLVTLSLLEQIIKDTNSMCIYFTIKQLKTFQELQMSLSNMSRTISNKFTYTFKLQLIIKTYFASHDYKPKVNGIFILKPLVLNLWGILVFIRLFVNCSKSIYSKYILLHACWRPFATIFKCSNFENHYTFFKCFKFEL